MTDKEQVRLTKAAADYMKQQFGEDAILEAKIGRRHAEVIGDRAAVEAFQAILDYLEARPGRDEQAETGDACGSMGEAQRRS
ncbi:hypothetical protein [Aureimonas psammosilenae]|uniref:hypothetical protein n=1 Tax=Aureimonas psammosilenae TaxID=2495496 RepID=UPI001869EC32|nr:hypothetical protein [Aureimonas psammosilenae]